MPDHISSLLPALQNIATRLRIDSIRSTTEAASGHPTSCCSAAEIVATLFFAYMRFDPKEPQFPYSDRFVLSKGHAAPLLYAAWAESGGFDRAELMKLRKLESDLEGHPTPRLPFVDVATGSLGQGPCVAVGIALNARRLQSNYRTYVLLGDGESAEGAIWEAAQVAVHHHLDNLCGITDVNGLGQSGRTQWGHDVEELARRWRAFGWHTCTVDGHDIKALYATLEEADAIETHPTMILARTIKGKGVSLFESKSGWHGKPVKKGEELDRVLAELDSQLVQTSIIPKIPMPSAPSSIVDPRHGHIGVVPEPSYEIGASVATREAYGTGITALGSVDSRVVALDGDVKNSTFSETFEKVYADRFYQMFIAEQALIGVSMGLASRGAIPFPSTFAAFLTRASDFIRMAGISNANVKIAGSHAGVSIGEDGPSQMALEDIAMMRAVPNCVVLYPCDAVSTERLVSIAAYHHGPTYIRTTRPKTPVIYSNSERFEIGGSKILRENEGDQVTVVAGGVTVFEALKAYEQLKQEGTLIRVFDAYSLQPIDAATLVRSGRQTGNRIITVEDHYPSGGLGDAVSAAVGEEGISVHRLAVREIPRSGKPDELLERYGISAGHIVSLVHGLTRS